MPLFEVVDVSNKNMFINLSTVLSRNGIFGPLLLVKGHGQALWGSENKECFINPRSKVHCDKRKPSGPPAALQ